MWEILEPLDLSVATLKHNIAVLRTPRERLLCRLLLVALERRGLMFSHLSSFLLKPHP